MNWTLGTLSTTDPWNCVTFGDKGLFVTIANISGNTAYSSDGITWTQGRDRKSTRLNSSH